MKQDTLHGAEKYMKSHRWKKRWYWAVTCLSAVVVFCTVYALVRPAVTLEHGQCPIPEHIHDGSCYTKVASDSNAELVCSPERLGLHEHTEECFDEDGNAVCGLADFVVHTHDESCLDADGNLSCELPVIGEHRHTGKCYKASQIKGHRHTASCYTRERGELICTREEGGIASSSDASPSNAAGHVHSDRCYEWEKELICDQDEKEETSASEDTKLTLICEEKEAVLHRHTKECFDKDGTLICGRLQVLKHTHEPICFSNWERTCGLEEHVHTARCLREAFEPNDVVILALVDLEGEVTENFEGGRPLRVPRAAVSLNDEGKPGNVADYLQKAEIIINGEPYVVGSELNPGEQFSVRLMWQLEYGQLANTLEYTYTLPEQIKVQDVEAGILYDKGGARKGTYSIKDGVLTVTYDSLANRNTTTLEINATWDEEAIKSDSTIHWNDTLETPVNFDNAAIAVTKEKMNAVNLADGGFAYEYAVQVKAKEAATKITLTDTLESQKFKFLRGYYKADDGQTYDYRYKITGPDEDAEYTYGNFTDDEKEVIFSEFDLGKGQTYTVEYAVELPLEERVELDSTKTSAGLKNTAEASYPYGDKTISASAGRWDSYEPKEDWVIKQKEDGESDTMIPWKVVVNPNKDYDMGGAVISDRIATAGVVYVTDTPVTITAEPASDKVPKDITWITLSDDAIKGIRENSGSAIDLLFKEDGAWVLKEINEEIKRKNAENPEISKENKDQLSSYVFVNEGANQFVWFVPETGVPTQYTIQYDTDASKIESAVISNNATAGFRGHVAGTTVGSFLQEVTITKENEKVYTVGEDYFVDWTITLNVPEKMSGIPDVFLYDALPAYSNVPVGEKTADVVYVYDWLKGLASEEFDYKRFDEEKLAYLHQLAQGAFEIKTDSKDEKVQELVKNAYAVLGHPHDGLGKGGYVIYDGDQATLGQLKIVNGGPEYSDSRVTPARFGIRLGNLPATTEAYTITVKYTTQVNPAVIDALDGKNGATNYAGIFQRNDKLDTELAVTSSEYWVECIKKKDCLEKDVISFDPDTGLLTYQVLINPDVNLVSEAGYYVLKDAFVQNVPGAEFIKDSFELRVLGTYDPNTGLTYEPQKRGLIWTSKEGTITAGDFPEYLIKEVGKRIEFAVGSGNSDQNGFTLCIDNDGKYFQISQPEEHTGKFPSMLLTYQVKVPEATANADENKLVNRVQLYAGTDKENGALLDDAGTEFDYSSAMHKQLKQYPTYENKYTAVFAIDVDADAEEIQKLDEIKIRDEMSRTLKIENIDSIQVLGEKEGECQELLSKDNYEVLTYEEGDKNVLCITLPRSQDPPYVRYHIEYEARVRKENDVNVDNVEYSNSASIEGTGIKSEEIKKQVRVEDNDSQVDDFSYKVKIIKHEGANINNRLENVVFNLYKYAGGEWEPIETNKGFKTDDEGVLELNIKEYPGVLRENTWYKLVETKAPDGYLPGTTYFYIGDQDKECPDGKEIPYTRIEEEGDHRVPNYKAELKIRKVDADCEEKNLSGAVFELYSSADCEEKDLVITAEPSDEDGICILDLNELERAKKYYLKETKAPDGYQLSDEVYEIIIDEKGKVTVTNHDKPVNIIENTIVVPNQSGYKLPETGGNGTLPYVMGGLLMAMNAALLLLYSRKGAEKKIS